MSSNPFLYKYLLKFKQPQLVNGELLKERQGVLLVNSTTQQYGEAAPLPGFSVETLDDVLQEIIRFLKHHRTALSWDALCEMIQCSALSSASQFCLFSFFLPRKAYSQPTTSSRAYIDTPSFISNWQDKVLSSIHHSINQGTLHIKVKMSSYSFDQTVELLKKIFLFNEAKLKLHLDFNQNLLLDEAIELFRLFPGNRFFFIEDPVKDLKDLDILTQACSFPLALDQMCRVHPWIDLKSLPQLKCLMLKPTLSMKYLLDTSFIAYINSGALSVDLSSSYESAFGLRSILKCGNFLFHRFSYGIDTVKLFATHFTSVDDLEADLYTLPKEVDFTSITQVH